MWEKRSLLPLQVTLVATGVGNKLTFNTIKLEPLPLCKILESRLCPYVGYPVIQVVIYGPNFASDNENHVIKEHVKNIN